MDISVIIVNWNTGALLVECLESIRRLSQGVSHEIIVVDNASADRSPELVKKRFPECRLIESDWNLGFVKANNLALKEARGRYVFFLNPDTRLVTNALKGLFDLLEGSPSIGAAGCRLVDPSGSIQYTCASAFPTPGNELNRLLLLNRILGSKRAFSAFASRELDYWDHRDSREVECLSGACMFVRKEILDTLGGFDENIYMYAEDLELCRRIIAGGWKIYYLSSEVIVHYEGAGSGKRERNFSTIMQNESNLYFIRKYNPPWYALLFRTSIAAGSFFRLMAALACVPLFTAGMIKSGAGVRAPAKYLGQLLWSIGLRRAQGRRKNA